MADQSLGSLYAELALKTDKLEDGSKRSTAAIRKLNTDIDRMTDDINAKLESIGKGLSIGVTAPLAILGYTAAKTFTSFEQAMQNTYSVMGASAAEMEQLRYAAEKMGADTRFSASQAADALYNLGSSGQNAQQAIKSLDGVLALAGATQSDLAFTSETLSSTLSQFNLDASQSSRVADVYAQAISKSQANMNKLAYSMRYVGPIAAGMGQDLEGTTAALMALYNAGYQGEQAGTIMRGALTTLANETADLDKKLAAVGLTYQEVNPQINSFADIIGNISKKTKNTSDVIKIFGDVAGSGMAKLVAGGDEAIRTFDQMLSSSEGAASAMQKIQNTSLANTVDEMTSAWEGLQITITDNVEPAISAVIKAVTEALRIVNDLPPGFQVAGTTALAFAAAAGPILLVAVNIKKLKNEMAMLNIVMTKNPFIMWGTIAATAVSVVAGVVVAVKNAQQEYDDMLNDMVKRAEEFSAKAAQGVTNAINVKGLADEFAQLATNTNRSQAEQSRYNELIGQLKELMPDAVTAINEQTNAVELNAQKVKEAAETKLRAALSENQIAIQQQKAAAVIARQTVRNEEDRYRAAKQQEQQLRDQRDKTLAMADEISAAIVNMSSTTDANVYETLNKEISDYLGIADAYLYSEKELLNLVAKKYAESEKSLNKFVSGNEKLYERYENATQVVEKLNGMTQTQIELTNQLNGLSGKPVKSSLMTQAEAVSTYLDGASAKLKEQYAAIEKSSREAEKYGETYNVAEKKAEALAGILREMIALQPGKQIAEGFTLDSTLLAPWFDALARLKTDAKETDDAIKNLGKNKSQGTRLTELDTEYKYMMEIAKAQGRDTYDIEQEWYKKRIELAESFILEDRKNGVSYADSVSSRLKGTNKTVGEVLEESKNLVASEMKALIHEYEVNQRKLDDAQSELSSIDAQLIVPENIIPGSTLAQLNLRKEELLKLIAELKTALGMDIKVTDPLKDAFEKAINIENVKLAEDAQKRYTSSLVASQSVLERGSSEWMKIQKEIDDSKKKVDELKQKQANAFLAIANPVTSIGQSLADAIAVGIEEGGAAGFMALLGQAGNLTSSIGALIGNPMLQAIGGVGSAVIGIMGTVFSAVDAASKRSAQNVKDYNDKISADIEKRAQEAGARANVIMSDISDQYLRAFQAGNLSKESIFDSLLSEKKEKELQDKLKNFGDMVAYEQGQTVKKLKYAKGWNVTGTDWILGVGVDHWTYFFDDVYEEVTETVTTKNNQLWDAFFNAPTPEAQAKAKAELEKSIENVFGKQDINLASYVNGIEQTVSDYVLGNITFDEFGKSLREKINDAVLSYALNTMMLNQINSMIDNAFNDNGSPGQITAQELANITTAAEKLAENIKSTYKSAIGSVAKDTKTGLAAISDEWTSLGESITSSLSDALGEAAFDADYASFRNSFAEQMKKAIIQSAIKNFGVADKVQAIINGAMADGTISGAEVTDAIGKLQVVYNQFESSMGSISQIVNGLTDAEIKSETSGTIIQQLSGGDRDYLAEAIRSALSMVTQTLNFTDAAIQSINATQLIINSLNYNHSGDIYVQGTDDTDLRSLLGELITQALGSK